MKPQKALSLSLGVLPIAVLLEFIKSIPLILQPLVSGDLLVVIISVQVSKLAFWLSYLANQSSNCSVSGLTGPILFGALTRKYYFRKSRGPLCHPSRVGGAAGAYCCFSRRDKLLYSVMVASNAVVTSIERNTLLIANKVVFRPS